MLSFVLSSGITDLKFVVILLPQSLVLRLNYVSIQKAVCVGWGWLFNLLALTSISEVNCGSWRQLLSLPSPASPGPSLIILRMNNYLLSGPVVHVGHPYDEPAE